MKVEEVLNHLAEIDTIAMCGRIAHAAGLVIEGYGPVSSIGELCEIVSEDGAYRVPAEVVGFRGQRVLLMPLGELRGIGPSSRLVMRRLVGAGGGRTGKPVGREGPDHSRQGVSAVRLPPQPLASAAHHAPD